MDKITRLTSQQRTNLVAYLDGELDETTTKQIEQTLAGNAVARHEVEMLTRTWEMLDDLPRATVSDDFTVRTLASIKVEEIHPPLSESWLFQQARRGAVVVGWVAALAVAATIGFWTTHRWIPTESDLLFEDYPVIENLDVYSEIEDIDFLRDLERSGLFNAPPKGIRP